MADITKLYLIITKEVMDFYIHIQDEEENLVVQENLKQMEH